MTHSGYTLLKSALDLNLYIGFNHNGNFESASKFQNPKLWLCFRFSKIEFSLPKNQSTCSTNKGNLNNNHYRQENKKQNLIYNIAKKSFLSKIEI